MNNQTYSKTIIFDLDGTLLDTWPSLYAAVLAFDCTGKVRLDPDALRLRLSDGIGPMLSLALRQLNRNEAEAHDDYRQLSETYENDWLYEAKPFEGSQAMLHELHIAGYRLGLCTNRDPASTKALLDHFGWDEYFVTKVCLGDVENAKPHPDPLLTALSMLDCAPGDALFVGDSNIDALCAANANVPFAAHLGGYHSHQSDLDPCVMTFSHFSNFAGWIGQHRQP
ncbi:HAD family hydrolase [Alcaligenaceae bacterium]|nr:HAD family hydrolase [Alcaligenaceae bacterium]